MFCCGLLPVLPCNYINMDINSINLGSFSIHSEVSLYRKLPTIKNLILCYPLFSPHLFSIQYTCHIAHSYTEDIIVIYMTDALSKSLLLYYLLIHQAGHHPAPIAHIIKVSITSMESHVRNLQKSLLLLMWYTNRSEEFVY